MFMAEDTTADGLNAEVKKLKGENFDSGVGCGWSEELSRFFGLFLYFRVFILFSKSSIKAILPLSNDG